MAANRSALREADVADWRQAGIVAHARLLPPLDRRDERMGMAAPIYYTADMVRALPEDAAWHQRVVLRLASALESYLRRHPAAGVAFTSPADISWGPDVLVQPDVFVVPADEARTRGVDARSREARVRTLGVPEHERGARVKSDGVAEWFDEPPERCGDGDVRPNARLDLSQ